MLNIAICEDDKYSSTVVENALINNFVDLKLNLDIFESPDIGWFDDGFTLW